MGKDYCVFHGVQGERTTDESMRQWCSRPGKRNADGSIQYKTEQNHRKECDINEIIRKYDKNGLITHIQRFEARFGDLSGVDFKTAMDTVTAASESFNKLPSSIRKRFSNNPEELLRFMEDPGNREEGIRLGLIHRDIPPDRDGFGDS